MVTTIVFDFMLNEMDRPRRVCKNVKMLKVTADAAIERNAKRLCTDLLWFSAVFLLLFTFDCTMNWSDVRFCSRTSRKIAYARGVILAFAMTTVRAFCSCSMQTIVPPLLCGERKSFFFSFFSLSNQCGMNHMSAAAHWNSIPFWSFANEWTVFCCCF